MSTMFGEDCTQKDRGYLINISLFRYTIYNTFRLTGKHTSMDNVDTLLSNVLPNPDHV